MGIHTVKSAGWQTVGIPRVQLRSLVVKSRWPDSIWDLKREAAKGRTMSKVTSEGLTVMVAEADCPMAEPLKVPTLADQFS